MWRSGMVWAILRRPLLWGEALRTLAAIAPRAWWTRKPRLPLPEPGYAAWRRATAYGSEDAALQNEDLIDFLKWRRRFRLATSSRGVTSG